MEAAAISLSWGGCGGNAVGIGIWRGQHTPPTLAPHTQAGELYLTADRAAWRGPVYAWISALSAEKGISHTPALAMPTGTQSQQDSTTFSQRTTGILAWLQNTVFGFSGNNMQTFQWPAQGAQARQGQEHTFIAKSTRLRWSSLVGDFSALKEDLSDWLGCTDTAFKAKQGRDELYINSDVLLDFCAEFCTCHTKTLPFVHRPQSLSHCWVFIFLPKTSKGNMLCEIHMRHASLKSHDLAHEISSWAV